MRLEVWAEKAKVIKAEFVIGYLNSRQPQLSSMNLQLNKIFSLARSGYSSICFTGYKTGSDDSDWPKPTPKDLTAEKASNLVYWPLSVDLTAKIMSMLGCSAQVACVELVSKIFYIAGLTSVAYRNVDLSNFPPAEDLTVLMCIQRSYGQPSSISVGCEKGPNRQYTSRFLEPLHSDYGRRITKMCLLDIPDITEDDLVSAFSQCTLLTELDIHCGEEISIDFVFRAMASHCPLLEVYNGEEE